MHARQKLLASELFPEHQCFRYSLLTGYNIIYISYLQSPTCIPHLKFTKIATLLQWLMRKTQGSREHWPLQSSSRFHLSFGSEYIWEISDTKYVNHCPRPLMWRPYKSSLDAELQCLWNIVYELFSLLSSICDKHMIENRCKRCCHETKKKNTFYRLTEKIRQMLVLHYFVFSNIPRSWLNHFLQIIWGSICSKQYG